MDGIIEFFTVLLALIRQFTWKDALDILVVTFIIYSAVKLVRETRAGQLVKGLLILVIVYLMAWYLDLTMLNELLNYFFQFTVVAFLVIFQPEIRRALEQVGRSGKNLPFGMRDREAENSQTRRAINAVADACMNLQRLRMGALIVFERETKLGEIIDTGTIVEAKPSAPVIGNIFFNKAPLHDGAMIIRDGVVYAAGCILPLTSNDSVSVDLGTRHRAALGMSENSDAVVVVVSEETGQVSIALNGILTRNYTRETLVNELESLLLEEKSGSEKKTVRMPRRKKAKH
ncbi:MAG TPA: diadenylate cyclase CdaA [Firmicutes bacterium]|nr:diadenylate cyclase CdaA [Bacillota bacterium]